jgi:hypothetical protein
MAEIGNDLEDDVARELRRRLDEHLSIAGPAPLRRAL